MRKTNDFNISEEIRLWAAMFIPVVKHRTFGKAETNLLNTFWNSMFRN